MGKKLMRAVLTALGTVMCIGMSACNGSGKEPRGTIGEVTEMECEVTPTVAQPTPAPDIIDPDMDVYTRQIDYLSENALWAFLSGDWYLSDRYTGIDYGVLTIAVDGSVEYKSMDADSSCTGSLTFTNHSKKTTPGFDMYRMKFTGIPEEYSDGDPVYPVGSLGFMHIAQSAGRDYLYLEEIGNGGSELVYTVFRSPYTQEPMMKWVLHRDNEVTATIGSNNDSTFYAMLWANDDYNGMLLQQLDLMSYETENEYTGFRYISGIFVDGEHTDAVWYDIKNGADLNEVFDLDGFNASYPGRIYSVTVDSHGDVEKVSEVETAGYGEYEIMPAKQNITYQGMDFCCNGIDYTLEGLGNVGNNIENVTLFGDYAIIEAHLNPHRSIYTVYNTRLRWPVDTLAGGVLLIGDDIWDYYISDMCTVYDGEGNAIYEVDGTEIIGLSFTDDQHIKVEYWKDDMTTVYEDIIDRVQLLNTPMYAYREFRRHQNAENWAKFLSYAPEDAVFMVMINPPSDDVWDFYQPRQIGDGGSDIVYAIALQDDTDFGFGAGESWTVNKGEMIDFCMMVPEGMPVDTLYAVTPDKSAEWPVATISGKDDTRWTFATK